MKQLMHELDRLIGATTDATTIISTASDEAGRSVRPFPSPGVAGSAVMVDSFGNPRPKPSGFPCQAEDAWQRAQPQDNIIRLEQQWFLGWR